jgi:hypothetical protein
MRLADLADVFPEQPFGARVRHVQNADQRGADDREQADVFEHDHRREP